MFNRIKIFLDGDLKFSIQSLEKKRRYLYVVRRVFSFFYYLMFFCSIIVLLGNLFANTDSSIFAVCWLIIFCIFVIYSIVVSCYSSKFVQYKKDVKTFVLKELFENISDFNYKLVNQEIYCDVFYSLKHLNLFGIFDEMLLDDCLKYSKNSINFDIYDLSLSSVASGYKTSLRQVIFSGVLVVSNFSSEFSGRTIVLPKFETRSFPDVEKVLLEDLEFNKYFNVYSSNQVEARFLLTTAFMERLLIFARNNNQKVYCAFEKGKVYIGLADPKEHDWFDIDMRKPLTDINSYMSLCQDLEDIETLVTSLRLDQN